MFFIFSVIFVYIFHILDYALGGGQIHLQPQSFVTLLPFVPTLKESRHSYPLTFSGSGGMACPEVIGGVAVKNLMRLTPV